MNLMIRRILLAAVAAGVVTAAGAAPAMAAGTPAPSSAVPAPAHGDNADEDDADDDGADDDHAEDDDDRGRSPLVECRPAPQGSRRSQATMTTMSMTGPPQPVGTARARAERRGARMPRFRSVPPLRLWPRCPAGSCSPAASSAAARTDGTKGTRTAARGGLATYVPRSSE
jgi:hypothetical protein